MYPSNSSGTGIPSPFGTTSSVHAGNNLLDNSFPPAFSWLTQFPGHNTALINDQSAVCSRKIGSSDHVMDCSSFTNFDHRGASFSRGGSSDRVMDSLTSQQQQPPDGGGGGAGAIVDPFHRYPCASDGVPAPAMAHHSLSNSQFAAFDSVYKAYQNAFGSGSSSAVGMFGDHPYRYDGSTMTAEQQMLLQASMLQYPHVGFFPNAASYHGLHPGFRNSVDYYYHNMANLSLLSMYQDLAATSWLGVDRLSSVPSLTGEQVKEGKDYDTSREQIEFGQKFERGSFDHYRMRHDRDDGRHESKVEEMRREHSNNGSDSSRHFAEKSLRNEQIKRFITAKSPTKQEQRHTESNLHKNVTSQNSCAFSTSRLHGFVSRASLAEPLNLQKPPTSPDGVIHQQKCIVSSKDRDHRRSFDLPQYPTSKERRQTIHSATENARDKRGVSAINLPKPASTMAPFIKGEEYEPKFHRPFEQLYRGFSLSGNDKSEALERPIGILSYGPDRSYNNSKTSPVLQHNETNIRYLSDDRASGHENYDQQLYHNHHSHRYRQQQQLGKPNNKKILSSSITKRRLSDINEDLPLNLALAKVARLDSTTAANARGGELERSSARFLSNLAMQESLVLEAGNNHMRKKTERSVVHKNSSVCGYKAKTYDFGQSDTSKATSQQGLLPCKFNFAKKTSSTNDESLSCIEEANKVGISRGVAKHPLITSGPVLTEENSRQKLHFLGMFGLMAVDISRTEELRVKQKQQRCRLIQEFGVSSVQVNSDAMELSSALNTYPRVDCAASADKAESQESDNPEQPTLSTKSANSPSLHQNYKCHHRRIEDISNDTTVLDKSIKFHEDRVSKYDNGQQRKRSTSGSDFRSHKLPLNASDKLSQFGSATNTSHNSLDLPFAFDSTASQEKRRLLDLNHSDETTDAVCCSDSVVNGKEMEMRKECTEDTVFTSRACLDSDAVATVTTPSHSSSFSASLQRESPDDSLSAMHVLEADQFRWPGIEAVAESYYHYAEDRSLERRLIGKHNRRLHLLNSDLMQKLPKLQNHMTRLLEMKDVLTENQHQLQSKIENLETIIKAFQ